MTTAIIVTAIIFCIVNLVMVLIEIYWEPALGAIPFSASILWGLCSDFSISSTTAFFICLFAFVYCILNFIIKTIFKKKKTIPLTILATIYVAFCAFFVIDWAIPHSKIVEIDTPKLQTNTYEVFAEDEINTNQDMYFNGVVLIESISDGKKYYMFYNEGDVFEKSYMLLIEEENIEVIMEAERVETANTAQLIEHVETYYKEDRNKNPIETIVTDINKTYEFIIPQTLFDKIEFATGTYGK